jgi:hypothetical protein
MTENCESRDPDNPEQIPLLPEGLRLAITLDVAAGAFRFEWTNAGGDLVAGGRLLPSEHFFFVLRWVPDAAGNRRPDGCIAAAASVRALLERIRKPFPVPPESVFIGLLSDVDLGTAQAGQWLPLALPPRATVWSWMGRQTQQFARLLESSVLPEATPALRGQAALRLLACSLLKIAPPRDVIAGIAPPRGLLDLRVTFNQVEGFTLFDWKNNRAEVATGRIRCSGLDELTWELTVEGAHETDFTTHHRNSIRAALGRWLTRFPANLNTFAGFWVEQAHPGAKPQVKAEPAFGPEEPPYGWMEDNIVAMAQALRHRFSPFGQLTRQIEADPSFQSYSRKWLRKQQKLSEAETRRQETMARLAQERRLKDQRRAEARAAARARQETREAVARSPARQRLPLPPVPTHLELPPLEFQETAFAQTDLHHYLLRERAARWWISNQSDDLLCLPYCHLEHLEYQLRTALRVLGPLRGRALLSDEVGLGKTIEAALVIKELLTRGMVKRYLVLTVPSLVDQWEEELNEKFGLSPATTNQGTVRDAPSQFWGGNAGIVASLHTLKQPAHLDVARQVTWDILVVDEAHYLRNRDSQAWQAVNALPRQFLLLLTATPVQNSLEELYNLVTLLQPGQLPAPKEFRARFMDPKQPRRVREPQELRRLLGQVMIRNTRANAGVQLPPRRAETVLFEPHAAESAFWREWEVQFRSSLSRLNNSQASLWGRLLLQAAGSSPAAWRASLKHFPDSAAAQRWREGAPLADSWARKCDLIPPLTRVEGGTVIFTQFLETQAALAGFLQSANIQTFVINGQTPAPQRQPITEEFRKRGGALLLTHSGTEGRNLQFCHRLVNFDLPWNPMEIEQRIGRLHRLGQQHPVRIYNFVQAGTLQEHLLDILQEKLNLFELVVGETGLVLGERFGSDEFAEEVLRRWRESEGRVAEALASLGEELAAARNQYGDIKKLDETLFAKDYESL